MLLVYFQPQSAMRFRAINIICNAPTKYRSICIFALLRLRYDIPYGFFTLRSQWFRVITLYFKGHISVQTELGTLFCETRTLLHISHLKYVKAWCLRLFNWV